MRASSWSAPSSAKIPTIASRIRSRCPGSAAAAIASCRPSSVCLEVLGVPGGEGLRQRRIELSVLGLERQARPRGQPLSAKIAGQRLDDGECLRGLIAGEQNFGQARGRVGMARVELERLSQGRLVAGGGELIGRRGDERVEPALDLGRRDRSCELGDDLAVAKRLHRGDPLDPEASAKAPGWSRRRPSPARPCPLAWRPQPRARGRAGGTGRTTPPRSRPRPAAHATARRPRP